LCFFLSYFTTPLPPFLKGILYHPVIRLSACGDAQAGLNKMKIPIQLSELETKTKTEAVVKAIKDEIRLKKMEKIKAMAGKMEFVKSADKLRHEDERLR